MNSTAGKEKYSMTIPFDMADGVCPAKISHPKHEILGVVEIRRTSPAFRNIGNL